MDMNKQAGIVAILACSILASSIIQAQTAPPRVVVRAGHVLDVKSGKVLADQAIVIEGDKIISVGPAAGVQLAGATTINLPNSTVLPGLIDSHVHLTGDLKNIGYRSLGISLPRATLTGAKNARVTLDAGFTTVRNVGAQGILWATEAGVDSIEHGSYINDEAIAAMKQHGTYLVPTLYLSDWFLENAESLHVPPDIIAKGKAVMPAARKNVAHAFAGGVKVAFGTDAAVYPHGLNAREFAVMVKLGLTPVQAIQAATINAADLLGWSDKVGAVEPGKWADLVAVDEDPLQNISTLEHVKFVMKGGAVVRNDCSTNPPQK
jgi:imidazolonepropionase-like amidohydrolase